MSAGENQHFAGIIHDEALRLTRLLDDLLDLSVLENGQVTLNTQNGTITELLDRAIVASGVKNEALKIRRSTTEAQVHIATDLDRLVQVFVNILANAAKYCTHEAPELTIKVHQHKGRDVVDFIDNGPGVALSHQDMIFEKFARLEDQSKAGGAGLGLAICREVMSRLGGEISYLPGRGGAAFRVVLPLTQTDAVAAPILATQ